MSLAGQTEFSHNQMIDFIIKANRNAEAISFFFFFQCLDFLLCNVSPMLWNVLVKQRKTVACHNHMINCFMMRENREPVCHPSV